jgi:hypothetical protein
MEPADSEVTHQAEPKPRGKPGRKKGGHDAKPRVRRAFGPYKLDKVTAREFIKNIKIGCPMAMAAGAAGVTVQTIYGWLRKGKGSDAPEELRNFRRNFRLARHFAGQQDVKTLFKASIEGDTDAAKWRLAHRYPKQFGVAATKVELTGAAGGPIETRGRLETMSAEEMAARIVRATQIARGVLERGKAPPPSEAIEVTATTTTEGAQPALVATIEIEDSVLPLGIGAVGVRPPAPVQPKVVPVASPMVGSIPRR